MKFHLKIFYHFYIEKPTFVKFLSGKYKKYKLLKINLDFITQYLLNSLLFKVSTCILPFHN